MREPIVSIIVPVYKVERFLQKCLDSIINQTYKNLDIILVDDGSPDRCGIICDEYAAKDSRIQVIHKHNEGLVLARLSGYEISKGDYLLFVDSDDFITNDAVEIFVKYALCYDVDMVIAQHFIQMNDKCIGDIRSARKGLYNKHEIEDFLKTVFLFDHSIRKAGFPLYQWGKLIRKACICGCIEKGYGVFAEDMVSVFCTLQNIHSMMMIDEPLYYYVSHEAQITNKSREELWNGFSATWKRMRELDKENYLVNQLPERMMYMIASTLLPMSLQKEYSQYKSFITSNLVNDFYDEVLWNNKQFSMHSMTVRLYHNMLKREQYYVSYIIGKYNIIDRIVRVYNFMRFETSLLFISFIWTNL